MPVTVLFCIAVAANVLGAAMAAPQARRLHHTRRVDGVSPAWAGLSVTLNSWWLAYALGTSQPIILPVSIVSVLLYAAVVTFLIRLAHSDDRRIVVGQLQLSVLGGSLLPTLALLVHGWGAVGVVLGALYSAQLAPAVLAAYRSPDVTGISPGTWQLAWVEAVLFGIYGLATGTPGLVALAVSGVVGSTLILGRLARRRPVAQRLGRRLLPTPLPART